MHPDSTPIQRLLDKIRDLEVENKKLEAENEYLRGSQKRFKFDKPIQFPINGASLSGLAMESGALLPIFHYGMTKGITGKIEIGVSGYYA